MIAFTSKTKDMNEKPRNSYFRILSKKLSTGQLCLAGYAQSSVPGELKPEINESPALNGPNNPSKYNIWEHP